MASEVALVGFYDYRLVALSVLLAMLASYAALDLAGRITSARGPIRSVWLAGGAAAMGLGIWSMHYIGMLAYDLPVEVLYDWPTVLVSLLAAVLASGEALWVVSQKEMDSVHSIVGGVLMGIGIAGMHYIGMEAMRLPAMCRYSVAIVALSVVLAIGISWIALWLTFRLRDETVVTGGRKLLGAIVMGAAIPVMHYTGMAAVTFMPMATMGSLTHSVKITSLNTVAISAFTMTILGLTILASRVDRRLSRQAFELRHLTEDAVTARENLTQVQERLGLTLRFTGIAVWNWHIEPNIIEADENCSILFGLPVGQFPKKVEEFAEFVHPDDRERVQREIAASVERSAEYTTEFRLVCPGGDVRTVAARGKVYHDERG